MTKLFRPSRHWHVWIVCWQSRGHHPLQPKNLAKNYMHFNDVLSQWHIQPISWIQFEYSLAHFALLPTHGSITLDYVCLTLFDLHSPSLAPDLIWATSSPCARTTAALPATDTYLTHEKIKQKYVKINITSIPAFPSQFYYVGFHVTSNAGLHSRVDAQIKCQIRLQPKCITVSPTLQVSPHRMMHSPAA